MRSNVKGFVKKIDIKSLKSLGRPVAAIIISFIIGAILMSLAGYSPSLAFKALFDSSFKNPRAFANALVAATPLLFTGIAVAFAFKGSVFNIGAEGQFLVGAIAATWIGVSFGDLPRFVLISLVIIAGAIAGAIWGIIPGYLKARHNVSEVITTIMLNYIALRLIGYLVKGPLQAPGSTSPQSAQIADSAILSILWPKTQLHMGYLIGIVIAIVVYIILFKTYWGYEIRAVGFNPIAAEYNGINVNWKIVSTLAISGAIAGIGGAIQISGVAYRLYEAFSPGYGYTAIAVSMLVNNNPIGVIFSSLLFGILNCGASAMQRTANVSAVFVAIFQGIIILSIAASAVSNGRKKTKLKKMS